MCSDDIKLRIQGLLERCRKHSGLFWTATEGSLKEILVMSKAPGATDESISDLLRPYERGIATFEDVAGLPVVDTDLESEIERYVGYPAGDPGEDLGTTRVREAARYFAEWGRRHPKEIKYCHKFFGYPSEVDSWLKEHPEKTVIAMIWDGSYYVVFYSESI